MESINISKFKEYCLRLLEQVNKSTEPLEITKNGEPLVVIYPAVKTRDKSELFGCMKGSGSITGEIVSPIPLEDQDWDALK